ncbi:hypothetical protein BDN72DRAFT_965158 [Pluteus cervinus]|uniref:Uncharacterized protein n=1 Tax=Pluteus cervinus TaxID=181527 RepID=A0ACD3A9G3_9AGAR|nr:hypothetical protein BDN72DRAFT_965158 [Pluteus cervinus]
MMDGAYALPEELWAHILKFLPNEDLKAMARVHRVFRTYASSMICRSLTVCSLQTVNVEAAKTILENPHLARQVTKLCLQPISWVPGDGAKPWPNLWIISAPTFWDVLKYVKWSYPVLSWRYYHHSLESIRISTKVIPLLTNIREIAVVPYFYNITSGLPPLEPYRALWAGLRTEHLQRLNLQLLTIAAIQVMSGAMKSASPVVFGSLQTLTLDLGPGQTYYPKMQEDLRAILDCGRGSLRSFGISFDLTGASYIAEVVGTFGFFPNLAQFHFESVSFTDDGHVQLLGEHLIPFLSKHQSTLRKLHFSTFPIFGSILQFLCGDHNDQAADTALRLEAFTLGYRFSPYSRGTRMPNFGRFAETLTFLILRSLGEAGGLLYEDVTMLFNNLHHPTYGVRLKRLWIHVQTLSPELIDLMAMSLTDLEFLELRYGVLVEKKDQTTHNEALFLQNLSSHFYPHWGLRYLDVKSWSGRDEIPAHHLRDVIPALIEVGTIDWGGFELELGPWY